MTENESTVCATCGELHSLADMEPSFLLPAHALAVPGGDAPDALEQTQSFVRLHSDWADGRGPRERCFIRGLLKFGVDGRDQPVSFGIWAEVESALYEAVKEDREREVPVPEGGHRGWLANSVPGHSPLLGEPVEVRPGRPGQVPEFRFRAESEHELASMAREGVTPHQVAGWLKMNTGRHDAGDPLLELELYGRREASCSCCGANTVRLTRMVSLDGEALAVLCVFQAAGHFSDHTMGLISIGDWADWDEAPSAERVGFICTLVDEGERFGVYVQDKRHAAWDDGGLFGRFLDQEEALKHPWLTLVYRITDKAMSVDDELLALMALRGAVSAE